MLWASYPRNLTRSRLSLPTVAWGSLWRVTLGCLWWIRLDTMLAVARLLSYFASGYEIRPWGKSGLPLAGHKSSSAPAIVSPFTHISYLDTTTTARTNQGNTLIFIFRQGINMRSEIFASLLALAAPALAGREETVKVSHLSVHKVGSPVGTTIESVSFKLNGDNVKNLKCSASNFAFPSPIKIFPCGDSDYSFALFAGEDGVEFATMLYHDVGDS